MGKDKFSLNLKVTHQYDDIINMEYPLQDKKGNKHQRMPVENRAKIFAPFAALKGYEEAIEEKQRILVPRIQLSEEEKSQLDDQLLSIMEMLRKGKQTMAAVVYFEEDQEQNDLGDYLQLIGQVKKVDEVWKTIQFSDKTIQLEEIRKIEII